MGVLEEIKVQVEVEETIMIPQLKEYGSMIEIIPRMKFELIGGNTYGIKCECGAGGWAISYILAGREAAKGQKVYLNDTRINQQQIKGVGWYVGEGLPHNIMLKEKSILKQLRKGLKYKNNQLSIDNIITQFGLSEDRLHCRIKDLSWEKWRASLAIGYAHNKKIYVFPWLNTYFFNEIITNTSIHKCIDFLKKMDV